MADPAISRKGKPQGSRRALAKTARSRLQIADRNGLAQLLEEVVQQCFGGNERAAATATNDELPGSEQVNRSELNRLRHREVKSLRRATIKWLWRLVSSLPDGPQRLLATIVSPEQRERLAAYDRWLAREEREAQRLVASRRSTTRGYYVRMIIGDARKSHPAAFSDFDAWLKAVTARVPRRSQDWRRLNTRAWLAEYRAFSPFLGAVESGGIERRWDELTTVEQRRFAEHAMKCEMLLLRRPDDDARAQSDPGSFLTPGEQQVLEENRRLFGNPAEQPSDVPVEG